MCSSDLMNLTRLKYFIVTIDKNQSLIFNVTYDWVPPFKLKYLELDSCLIGSKFPLWLQVQSELTNVTLRNVGISGTIPEDWFSKISTQLTHLDLSNSQIIGKFPHHLLFPKVTSFDLSYNRFKGPIPLCFTNVVNLFLQSNFFSSPIPKNVGDLMPKLQLLALSKNHLYGTSPLSTRKMKYLSVLCLGKNQLSGEVPYHWNESQYLCKVEFIQSSVGFIPCQICLYFSN